MTLSYHEVPLGQVVEDLEKKLDVFVRLDPVASKQAGVSADTEVTFAIAKVSARSAIFHMLRPFGLTAITEHESLWITSPEAAEDKLTMKVYDVADLVGSGEVSDDDASEFSALIDVIQATVAASSWQKNGGAGAISGLAPPASKRWSSVRPKTGTSSLQKHCGSCGRFERRGEATEARRGRSPAGRGSSDSSRISMPSRMAPSFPRSRKQRVWRWKSQ